MRKMIVVLSLIASFLFTGCAAMFHGTREQVSIRSNVDGAKLYVNEEYIGTGSGVTSFKKNKKYVIVARKDGWEDGMVVPTKSFDPTTLLGVLIDFGIVTVLLVDGLATGAWAQYDQTSFVVDPKPKQKTA